MSTGANLLRCTRGAAAVEMAMVTPLLLIILMGSVELGNYFRNEHTLIKGVRDGARYAARQGFSNFATCDAAPGGTVVDDTKAVVRSGEVSGGDDQLPNWGSATFTVTTKCSTSDGTTNYGGIYSGMTGGARYVVVSASVSYRPIIASFGFSGIGLTLNATQQAAVMGI